MTKSKRSKATGYFPALTGLRAVAAALVFLHHIFSQWVGGVGPLRSLFQEGYVGVSIFFTLSGYLITRTYFSRIVRGEVGFYDYWFRRFCRIYPLYWFLLVIRHALYSSAPSIKDICVQATLTQALFSSTLFSGIGTAWSLTSEEFFYLLAPLIFLAIGKNFNPSKDKLRLSLFLMGITASLWWAGGAIAALNPNGDFLSLLRNVEIYNIFGRFCEFAIGVFAALTIKQERAIPRWVAEAGFILALIVLILGMYLLVLLRVRSGVSYGVFAPHGGTMSLWVISLGTILLIWSTVKGSRLSAILLGNPISEYLGRISFAAYLLQDGFLYVNVLVPFAKSWLNLHIESLIESSAILIGAAALVYELLEKPMHKRLLAWHEARLQPKRTRLARTV